MNIDILTIKLLFLFLPGIICAVIVARLTTHRDLKPLDYFIPSLIYGSLIFVIYNLLSELWNSILPEAWELPKYDILPTKDNLDSVISIYAIVIAIIIGVIVAFGISAIINKKLLHRLARSLRITRKFGDRDVWSYIMNSDGTEWLTIRDQENGLFYIGRLIAFSDEEPNREIVLDNTIVYDNNTGEERYNAGSVYFSFPSEGLIIEIPNGDR